MSMLSRRCRTGHLAGAAAVALCLSLTIDAGAEHRHGANNFAQTQSPPSAQYDSRYGRTRNDGRHNERRSLSGRSFGYRSAFGRDFRHDRDRAYRRHERRYGSHRSARGYGSYGYRSDHRSDQGYGHRHSDRRHDAHSGAYGEDRARHGYAAHGRGAGQQRAQYDYPGKPPTLSTTRPLRRYGHRY